MVIRKLAEMVAGDANKRNIKKAEKLVPKINEWFDKYVAELKTREDFLKITDELKERVQEKGESLDHVLPEAFGLVKAAANFLKGESWDVRGEEVEWDMVHYDVQLIGGVVMHQGKIAEMRTGEGKTLVCTCPVYLNALTGKGAFVVTVNEYLAQRDAEWMAGLYEFLGMSVGTIMSGQAPEVKKEIYSRDIIYGTNNEFGFDYLRDNMASKKERVVQRNLSFAIVDEVDSILIDEARTPLIISAPASADTEQYAKFATLVNQLVENEDFNVDEKMKAATLTEDGITKMEELLGMDNIYEEGGFQTVHYIEQALKAKALFKSDVDYVVKDGEVMIVDEFTGRLMQGRRYSNGLHQAIEAKEKVKVKRESKTLATVTFQNYFRLFDKLAGMTGTAKTEEEEFYKIYGLEVVSIPTHRPIQRKDKSDVIYKSFKGKLQAIAKDVKEINSKGQPVLIGTVSVEKSEVLGKLLKMHGVKHNVLNAKQHEKEADIVANAGAKGAVTIATNMAGRGTDIKLGTGVKELGGLYVIGTERHESRRIDNQLRGRSGRQGDPGVSQFYISMEDDLMRIFGGDRMKKIMESMNVPEDMPVESRIISKSIESAQKRVEGRNFDMRKHIVEYDDVMNYHREIVYGKRREILFGEDLKDETLERFRNEAERIVLNHRLPDGYDFVEIVEVVKAIHDDGRSVDELTLLVEAGVLDEGQSLGDKPVGIKASMMNDVAEKMTEFIADYFVKSYKDIEGRLVDSSILRDIEREVALSIIDRLWMEHIEDMQHLRQNVALQAYGQKNPLLVYKDEAYRRFQMLLASIDTNIVNTMFKIRYEDIKQLDVKD
jgi:preprotein translocase subunit SecA